MKNYKIVNDTWVELLEGPYAGVVYKYGKVQLIEDGEHLRIKFEYNLLDGSKLDNEFVQYIGPILTEMIEEGVLNNSLVYTGGVDEN